MRILHKDEKTGIFKIKIDSYDDLWILSRIIQNGDFVSSETTRVVKKTEEQEGKRVKLKVKLVVEKVEFTKNSLRILGKIVECSNPNVPHGAFHTISLERGSVLTIEKEWQNWQIKRLYDAVESAKKPRVILCAADYGDATIALLKEFGIEFLTDLSKALPGKKKETQKLYEKAREEFLIELAKLLKEISDNLNINKIVFGGVGFLPENFKKALERFPDLKKKVFIFKISTHGKTGINELIKRGAVEKVVKGSRISEETSLIEKFFEEVSKDGLATYGLNEVKKAVDYGAVEVLLVSDSFIQEAKDKGVYDKLNKIMEDAEKNGARVVIISNEHEAGERFSKIQIGALLRFKV